MNISQSNPGVLVIKNYVSHYYLMQLTWLKKWAVFADLSITLQQQVAATGGVSLDHIKNTFVPWSNCC